MAKARNNSVFAAPSAAGGLRSPFAVRRSASPSSAFTLIELLVVIGIMVLLAGLVVGLAGPVGDRKAISRTRAELERLALWIDTYKAKTGGGG